MGDWKDSPMDKLRIFLADDHAVVRAGLKTLVDAQSDMVVVGDKPTAELSERETDVVRLIAQGYSNKEIATQLNLSVKTVETYKARAMEKIGLDSRVALVRYALQRGWLQEL